MTPADLFNGGEASGEPLRLPDAEVILFRDFMGREACREYFFRLRRELPWREEEIVVWGKKVMQPRLICWVGDAEAAYTYSGKRLTPNPWTDDLNAIRKLVEAKSSASFNSVLLNLYRNERDSMGWHSDDEPELGSSPTIASLSLGTPRTFLMKHKTNKSVRTAKIPLTSGSLLVMSGPTQHNWTHSISKESVSCGPRINLTFRLIDPSMRPSRRDRGV